MVRSLARIEDGVAKAERFAVFSVLMGLVAVLFLQVLFRFVIERPLDFTEELARILLIWLVFLGAAHGSYTGQHFVVDFLFRACPAGFQRLVGPLIDLATVAFLALVLWVGWNTAAAATVQRLPVLGVPVMVQVAAMPAGAALMILHTVMLIVRRRAGLPLGEPGTVAATAVRSADERASADRREGA